MTQARERPSMAALAAVDRMRDDRKRPMTPEESLVDRRYSDAHIVDNALDAGREADAQLLDDRRLEHCRRYHYFDEDDERVELCVFDECKRTREHAAAIRAQGDHE